MDPTHVPGGEMTLVDFKKLITKEQEIIEGLQAVAVDLNYSERYANAIKTHVEALGALMALRKADATDTYS
jgi:hypothetical protein